MKIHINVNTMSIIIFLQEWSVARIISLAYGVVKQNEHNSFELFCLLRDLESPMGRYSWVLAVRQSRTDN